MRRTKIVATLGPATGSDAAINDLIAGRVHFMFESLNSIAPHARSGTVRGSELVGLRYEPLFPYFADTPNAFRVLAAGNEPDFRTIADFRKRHLAALTGFISGSAIQTRSAKSRDESPNSVKRTSGARSSFA
mgnify:CR=1 FL=1